MTEPTPSAVRKRPSRVTATLKALIRTRVSAGVITVLPIVITIWLVWVVFCWIRDASLWLVDVSLRNPWGRGLLIKWGINPDDLVTRGLAILPRPLQWSLSLFFILLTFFLLYVIGLFTANVMGRALLGLVDRVVERVPFVKTIYRTLKQILALFGGQQTSGFQRVALVPFPNELTRSVGFITNTFNDSLTGEELCTVFIATTPNPTTGFVFVLRRKDIIEVNWSVEDAVKIVMSGGILSPGFVTMVTGGQALIHVPAPPADDAPPSPTT